MSASTRPLGIDGRQLLLDLTALAEFGRTAAGAVTRIAYSEADMQARDWLDARFADHGMSLRRDTAGNSIAVLPGDDPALRPIVVGSHTDSVPEGGRYDGALGVIAALECVRALRSARSRLRHPLAVINFAAEEATMGGATFGSRALAGQLDPSVIERLAVDGEKVSSHLTNAGLDPDRVIEAACSRDTFAAYLELHIEQGPVLDEANVPIGIVEGMSGIRRYEVTFDGAANHAGTTPMARRRDALVMAAPFVVAVRDVADSLGIVGTVGDLRVHPGAPNVIPGRVDADVELRSTEDRLLVRAEAELRQSAGASGAEIRRLSAKAPVRFDAGIIERLERVCRDKGLKHQRLWSGAGHDAGLLASITAAAMIFVPSRHGISHSIDEFTKDEDCLSGADVLLNTIIDLDSCLSSGDAGTSPGVAHEA